MPLSTFIYRPPYVFLTSIKSLNLNHLYVKNQEDYFQGKMDLSCSLPQEKTPPPRKSLNVALVEKKTHEVGPLLS